MAVPSDPAPPVIRRAGRSGTPPRGAVRSFTVCRSCGKAHWYPRALCPFCFSADIDWRQASGAGAIYSFSVMRRASPPHAIAYVTLAEGPSVLT